MKSPQSIRFTRPHNPRKHNAIQLNQRENIVEDVIRGCLPDEVGERLNGIQEVSGSIPLISTRTTEIKGKALDFGVFLFCSFMKFFGRCDGVVTSVI